MKPLVKRKDRVKAKGRFDFPVKQVGATGEHVSVWLDNSLPMGAANRAVEVLARAEDSFAAVAAIFDGVTRPAVNLLIVPLTGNNDGDGGAYHASCAATDLYVDADLVNDDGVNRMLALFVAELTEVFEAKQNRGWDCGSSAGEGLSRFVAEYVHGGALDDYSTAAAWLDGPRADLVNVSAPTDEDEEANGCSTLFLFWLRSLGFKAAEIAAGPGKTLAALYLQLTGQKTAWEDFSAACQVRWPAGKPSGVTVDDPWALFPIPTPGPGPEPTPAPDPVPTPVPPPANGADLVVNVPLQPGAYVLLPPATLSRLQAAGLSWSQVVQVLDLVGAAASSGPLTLQQVLELLQQSVATLRKAA